MSQGVVLSLPFDLLNHLQFFTQLLLGVYFFLVYAWPCPSSPSFHLLVLVSTFFPLQFSFDFSHFLLLELPDILDHCIVLLAFINLLIIRYQCSQINRYPLGLIFALQISQIYSLSQHLIFLLLLNYFSTQQVIF